MKREQTEIHAMARDISDIKATLLTSRTIIRGAQEAAQYLGIAESTVYKLTSAGILPFSKPNGKLIYFSKAELDQWLLSNNSKSGEQKENEAATYVTTHQ